MPGPATAVSAAVPATGAGGRRTGSLDALLDKLAQWYERQTHELADTLAQTLEPLLMLVVGGIVGALVIAMYLPIFQPGSVLG